MRFTSYYHVGEECVRKFAVLVSWQENSVKYDGDFRILRRAMSSLIKFYKSLLLRFPVGSQAVQTGFLMGTGDLIAQSIVEKKPLSQMDPLRTGQFFFVGTLFVGPPLRIWYGALDRYFGNVGKMTALKKVSADQIVFAPAFLASIMTVVSVVQGYSFQEVKQKVSRDYYDVLISNYKLWPAVQMINFYLVPLNFQVLTVQLVAIFWNTYLSWKMNRAMEDGI